MTDITPDVRLCCRKHWRESTRGVPFVQVMQLPMPYACSVCGNKRCPHATNCELSCTNSNDPGQPGSDYE